MAKQIILYNLAEHVTDEQYREYVINEKGPLLDSMPGARKFEMVKITGSMSGKIPYKYIGIMHIEDMEKFMREALPSKKMQDFSAKWRTMVQPEVLTLTGEEIY
jgi:hypothetical protein